MNVKPLNQLGMIGYNEIWYHMFRGSAVQSTDTLSKILATIEPKPKVVVEIGTWIGFSATVFASYCDFVYTFDIGLELIPIQNWVWERCGVRHKIAGFALDTRELIKKHIDTIEFDFAFIDAYHDYDNVKADFAMVEHCGRVLFDDYHDVKGIKKFCDEIGAIPYEKRFAYWEKGK